jgi:hypothetical protein
MNERIKGRERGEGGRSFAGGGGSFRTGFGFPFTRRSACPTARAGGGIGVVDFRRFARALRSCICLFGFGLPQALQLSVSIVVRSEECGARRVRVELHKSIPIYQIKTADLFLAAVQPANTAHTQRTRRVHTAQRTAQYSTAVSTRHSTAQTNSQHTTRSSAISRCGPGCACASVYVYRYFFSKSTMVIISDSISNLSL